MKQTPEKPYIGVTGITKVNEARLIAQVFANEGLTAEASHCGMIGVLASERTLSSKPSRVAKYPSLHEMRKIFQVSPTSTLNTLHYNTFREESLSDQVKVLLKETGLYDDKLCQGLQLNLFWPPTREVERIKTMFPDLKIILQLGHNVLVTRNQTNITESLMSYNGLLAYVLIDPSGGRGTEFDINDVAPVYQEIKDFYPDLPIIFAGGFKPDNVKTRLLLLSNALGTNNFGIDAENGLRVQKEGPEQMRFNTMRTTKYIQNAASFFRNDQ